jgi:hypothetical protein
MGSVKKMQCAYSNKTLIVNEPMTCLLKKVYYQEHKIK